MSEHKNPSLFYIEPNSTFEKICTLAKQLNQPALAELLAQDKCSIDINQGIITPLTYLAAEKCDEAVDFLVKEFGANSQYALQGYAFANRTEKVNYMLACGFNLTSAILGYALNGNLDAIQELKSHYPKVSSYLFEMHTTFGLIIGNKSEKLTDMLKTNHQIQNVIAMGFVFNQDEENINRSLNDDNCLTNITFAYAFMGNADKVKELIIRAKNNSNCDLKSTTKSFYNALKGAITGFITSHHEQALQQFMSDIHKEDFDPWLEHALNCCVEAYAKMGNSKEVDKLLDHGADASRALRGYASFGKISQFENLYKNLYKYKTAKECAHALKHGIYGFEDAGYFSSQDMLLYLLSNLNDINLREKIEGHVHQNGTFQNIKDIHRKAVKLNQIMEMYNINYTQVLCLDKLTLKTILEKDVNKFVETALATFPIPKAEAEDLWVKAQFYQSKMNLVIDLKNFANSFSCGVFHKAHAERASSFASACERTKSESELKSLILAQQGLFNGKVGSSDANAPKYQQAPTHKKKNEFNKIIEHYRNPGNSR